MPTMYVRLWDEHDQEVLWPYSYGKNGKKSRKPVALKIPWWRKVGDGYRDLFYAITHWK
jgi:hypothetical protein